MPLNNTKGGNIYIYATYGAKTSKHDETWGYIGQEMGIEMIECLYSRAITPADNLLLSDHEKSFASEMTYPLVINNGQSEDPRKNGGFSGVINHKLW